MNPSSPWLRVIVGIVAAAIAIRLIADLLRPIASFLLAAVAIAGVIVAIHWWRNNRW